MRTETTKKRQKRQKRKSADGRVPALAAHLLAKMPERLAVFQRRVEKDFAYGEPGFTNRADGILRYAFAEKAKELVAVGADFVGGCCGTSPDFIAALRRLMDN